MTLYGFGDALGEICGRRGCNGLMGEPQPDGDCRCGDPGARPPCWACENTVVRCLECEGGIAEDMDSGPPPEVTPEMWTILVRFIIEGQEADRRRLRSEIQRVSTEIRRVATDVEAIAWRVAPPGTMPAADPLGVQAVKDIHARVAGLEGQLREIRSRRGLVEGAAAFARGGAVGRPPASALPPPVSQPAGAEPGQAHDSRFALIDLG